MKALERGYLTTMAVAMTTCFVVVGCTGNGTAISGNGTSIETRATPQALTIDGSTTIFPVAQAMAEDFGKDNPSAAPTVNGSGTGSGFQKFERGELDIAAASRPIEPKEDDALKKSGIEYIEIPIGYDGVSIVVNPKNTWVDKLTIAKLR